MLRLLALSLIAAQLSCQSLGRRPADTKEQRAYQAWAEQYKTARAQIPTAPDKACAGFQALSQDADFPARKLAELRATQVCPNTKPLDRATLPEWLKDLSLEIGLELAAKNRDAAKELELASEKSRQRLPQREKLKWLKLSIQRAEELKAQDKLPDLYRRLYLVAPRLQADPQEKDYLAVAADYRMAREFPKAHEYYERVIQSPTASLEDKVSALKGQRLAYKNARQLDKHLEAGQRLVDVLSEARKTSPRSSQIKTALFEAMIHQGRALWTQGHGTKARQIFERTEKMFRGQLPMAEMYWLRARMAEEDKDYTLVAQLLAQAQNQETRDSSLRDKILWYSAWNERRLGHLNESAQRFGELAEKSQDEFVRARALFWQAKGLLDAKNEEQAKPIFERLAQLDPLGYYGLLAHRQLGQAIGLKAGGGEDGPVTPPAMLDVRLAECLSWLDENDVLTTLLDQAANSYRKQAAQNDDGWIGLFKFYARAGLYMKLYESLTSLSPERRKSILENHPELLFPQPWAEDVSTASLQFGVKEELIYAIMRQESAFDPRARSGADAFGLMQLLPEVAQRLGSKNKVPYSDLEDLYAPRTNIQLGAAHLKELLSKYNNQFILAVASYNASETAIKGWLKTRYRGDSLEFIEEIPYEETRTYVRLVMRNMIFYSLLRSRSASIEFPHWVFDLN